jgi:hypothetical protein
MICACLWHRPWGEEWQIVPRRFTAGDSFLMIQSKLFVPGSIEVSPETLQTMAQSRSKRLIFACLKSRAVDN